MGDLTTKTNTAPNMQKDEEKN